MLFDLRVVRGETSCRTQRTRPASNDPHRDLQSGWPQGMDISCPGRKESGTRESQIGKILKILHGTCEPGRTTLQSDAWPSGTRQCLLMCKS